jgi:hypothetical protein
MRRRVALVGFGLLLAGCVRVPPTTAPAQRREGRRRWPTVALPTAAALSPDGKRTLVGFSEDPQVGGADPPEGKVAALWELETGKLAHIFGHDGGVYFVAFLPGGHALSAGGTTVKRWDLETGKQIWSANAYGSRGLRAALSFDCQRLLTWGLEGTKTHGTTCNLKLFDVRTGKLLRAQGDYQAQAVRNMTFAPKDNLAFITDSRGGQDWLALVLLDVVTGKAMESFPKGEAWKYPLAFSPDGKLALARRLPAGRTRTTAPCPCGACPPAARSAFSISSPRRNPTLTCILKQRPSHRTASASSPWAPVGCFGPGAWTERNCGRCPSTRRGALNTFSADAKRLLRVGGSFRVDPWNDPPRNMRDSFKGVPWDVRVILWDTATGKEVLAVKK